MPRTRAALPGLFWRLWAGALASNLGDGLVLVAMPLLALCATRNPLLIAGVAVAGQLPAFILAPVIGLLIDRADRRRLFTDVQLLQGVVTAGLALLVARGSVSLPVLYAAAAVLGACDTAASVATAATVPTLVDDADLERANGRLFVAEASARDLLGQGAGGVVFTLGAALPFIADAVSFAASALLLRRAVPRRAPAPAPVVSWRHELAEGFAWFARDRTLQRLAVLVCAFAGSQAAAFATLSLFLTDVVHAGHIEYGVLLMAGSVGSLAGTVAVGPLVRRYGSWATTGMGGIVAGYAYVLMALRPTVLVTGAALALEGGSVVVGNVASWSLRQRIIPDELRGRVGIAFRMALLGTAVLGAAVGGVLTAAVGVRSEIAVVASLQLLVVAAMTMRRRPVLHLVPEPVEARGAA